MTWQIIFLLLRDQNFMLLLFCEVSTVEQKNGFRLPWTIFLSISNDCLLSLLLNKRDEVETPTGKKAPG